MKTPMITASIAITMMISNFAFAQQKAGSDKLDVQALEQKYWTAKDDDFSVVQNRAFSKKGKFFGTAHTGVAINDPYFSGSYLGLSGGYFFNESWGVETNYLSTSFDKSRSFKDIVSLGGGPKANQLLNKIGINAIWTPIYAKMSLFDKSIIHFDMGFTVGLSQSNYESIYNTGTTLNPNEKGRSASATGYSIGIMQQFYFSDKMAIRVDFTNTFTTEDTVAYNVASGVKSGSKNINDTMLLIGFTVFDWRK
jgi:outer membrane beta-barrel protein